MNWSIRAKLTGLAAVSLIMIIITGLVGYFLLKTPVQMIRDQYTASQAMFNHMQGDMMHDALRGDVLSSITATKEADWESCRKDMAEHAANFREMLRKNTELPLDPEIKGELAKLAPKLEIYIKAAETTLGATYKDHANSAALLPKFLDAFEEMETAQGTLSELFKARAAAFVTENAKIMAHAGILLVVLALVACLIIGAFSFLVNKSISSGLRKVIASLTEGSQQVSSASVEVSQSSQQMAEGASEQASSLEETSASLEQMSSMTKQNSDNARQANAMADQTREKVEKSRSAMTRMSEAIGMIKNSSDQTAKIVKTIDEIAFQTNLLALNAAVEAARAGDAGKGFAVVAEEVRNLAQRSAEAAKNTSSLIDESQKNADRGVAVSQEVADILSQIVDSVGKLGQLIGEVSSASQEQAKGIEQIGTAVTEMDKLTQANAASAEESASASEELSAQANELKDMVNTLVGIVAGSNGTAARPAPALAAQSARANRGSAPKASRAPAPKAHPKNDWSAAPARTGKNGGNAYSPAGVRSANAEEVIPLSDDELKDF